MIANYYHLRGLLREGHEVTLVSLAPRGAPAARVEIDCTGCANCSTMCPDAALEVEE